MVQAINVKKCKKIDTRDARGTSNGWVLELVSDRDGFTKYLKGQVYLTVAKSGLFKGYHVHALADYYVTCIKGRVRDIIYTGPWKRRETEMGDDDFKTVFIPKGLPHALENIWKEDAYILIYRYPAWSSDVKEQLDIAPADIKKKESWKRIRTFCESFT